MTCPACGQHWCWICGRGFTDVSAHYSRLNLCGCPGLHMEGDYRDELTNCTAQLKICGRRALLFLPMLPLILFYYPLAIAASPIVMAIRPSCEDVPPAHMVLKSMFIDPFEDSCAGVKWTLLGLVCLPLLPFCCPQSSPPDRSIAVPTHCRSNPLRCLCLRPGTMNE